MWGYSKEQAEALHPGTMAWVAIPLVDEATEVVEGIVYLDSTDPEFFTDIRKTLAICACAGIAKYVSKV
jgi:putative methionine-R-sulfoxide reductase with GAF domain